MTTHTKVATLTAQQVKELRSIELHVFNYSYSLWYAKDHVSQADAAKYALRAAEHARTTWLNKVLVRDAIGPEGAEWQAPVE